MVSKLFLFLAFAFAAFSQQGGNTSAIPPVTSDPTGDACSANQVVVYVPSGVLFTCNSGGHFAAVGGSGPGGGADPCTAAITATPSGLHCMTATFTAAQVLDSCNNPHTVIPAPGAGLVIFPYAVRFKFTFVTMQYFFDGDMGGPYLWWGDGNNAFGLIRWVNNDINSSQLLVSSLPSTVAYFANGMSPIHFADPATYVNQPIVIQQTPFVADDCWNQGPLITITPGAAGAGYHVGDLERPANGFGDSQFSVATVDGGGGVLTLTIINAGSTTHPTPPALNTVNIGNIAASVLNMGGTLSAMGDTFSVDGGNGDATGVVDTVGGGGAVLTYHLDNQGTGYASTVGNTTTPTSGLGMGLTIDTTAAAGSGLTVSTTVTQGDGTLLVTIWYTVAAP
jgi:hypothetical protein